MCDEIFEILGCKTEQIAYTREEIGNNTKFYIGPSFPGIFEVANKNGIVLYTKFDLRSDKHKDIKFIEISIGGMSKKALMNLARIKNYEIDADLNFTTLYQSKKIRLVGLYAYDLGLTEDSPLDKVYQRAKELGLKLCPAEVTYHFRLSKYASLGESHIKIPVIAMEPINGKIFCLCNNVPPHTWKEHYKWRTNRIFATNANEAINPWTYFIFSLDEVEPSDRKPSPEDIIGCNSDEIAHSKNEISAKTKCYIGKLEPGIFNLFQKYGIKHIYTSFPENKIILDKITTGGKAPAILLESLFKRRHQFPRETPEDIQDIILSGRYNTNPTSFDLVMLRAKDLGLEGNPSLRKIYQRALQLGLNMIASDIAMGLLLADSTSLFYTYEFYNQTLVFATEPQGFFGKIISSEIMRLTTERLSDRLGSWYRGVDNHLIVFCLQKYPMSFFKKIMHLLINKILIR